MEPTRSVDEHGWAGTAAGAKSPLRVRDLGRRRRGGTSPRREDQRRFLGVVKLQASINRYLAEHKADPKPFRWQAHPDSISAAAAHGYQTLDSIH
jgi:hypothetical protein